MGHQFAQHHEAEVPASPDEVWAAIATGPGIDSWFMGRNEVKAGAGGTVRTVFGEYTPELEITGWDPAHRFAYTSGQAPDGRFIAYEFLIEGRAGGSTVLRTAAPVQRAGRPGAAHAYRLGGVQHRCSAPDLRTGQLPRTQIAAATVYCRRRDRVHGGRA